MTYRERQIRLILHQQQAKWNQEKQPLQQAHQDLNLILQSWKWENKHPKSAQEFISKFGKWIENKGWDQMEKENYEFEQENQNLLKEVEKKRKLESHFNSQIKEIYLLFDDKVKNYEIVNFMDLCNLLKEVAEREKERKELEKKFGNK